MSDKAPARESGPSRPEEDVGWVSLPPSPSGADAQRFVPGAVVGRYELLSLIANGGMAAVYLARVIGTSAPLLAIKRIHPHLATDENFGRMFVDEARIATRLHHRNVVPTHSLEDLGAPCIVMDFVDGDQLRRFMQSPGTPDGRIPPAIAVRIAIDMLRGLHAAHELLDDTGTPMDVVHRDVSPQNVLVGRDGVTRVTDFGIARARGRLAVTRQGLVRGKLRYMAPEQATPRETPPDRRADVFAAGIIVWEMITARRLFRGAEAKVVQLLLHDAIMRPREIRAGIDEWMDMAIMGALERETDVRFHSAAEFADALEAAAARGAGVASDADVAAFVESVMGPPPESPWMSPEADAGPGTDVEVMFSAGTLRRASEGERVKSSWPPASVEAPSAEAEPLAPPPAREALLVAVHPQTVAIPEAHPAPHGDAPLHVNVDADVSRFLRPLLPSWAVALAALIIAAGLLGALAVMLH